jgi:hypothetical protein
MKIDCIHIFKVIPGRSRYFFERLARDSELMTNNTRYFSPELITGIISGTDTMVFSKFRT